MIAMLHGLGTFVANLFKSRRRLELENVFLRHQLNIALRRAPQAAAPWERPGIVGMDDLALAKPARFVPRCPACHDPALASSGVSHILALEISRPTRAAASCS